MNKTLDSLILRYAAFALLFLAALYGLFLVRGALPVFLVGGILAYALEPVLQKMEKRGHSRKSAVGMVFLVYLLLFFIVVSLLFAAAQQARGLLDNATAYSQDITTLVRSNQKKINDLKLPEKTKESILNSLDRSLAKLQNDLPNYAKKALTYGLASIGTLLVFIVLLPIVTLWMMLEAYTIRGRLLMLVPPPYRRDVTDLGHSINELLGKYVRGQLIVCGTYGTLCTLAFGLLAHFYGMNYPLVLGAVAALVYIIPYFGLGLIVASVGLTAYFTASQPVPCTVAAVASCLIFNLIVDYGISPRVLGGGVGLHPLMVIFALLCGAQIGGPIGMVVAVPLFASLRVVAIYLWPQLAAPLPDASPATTADPGESEQSELMQRTSDAERGALVIPPAPAE